MAFPALRSTILAAALLLLGAAAEAEAQAPDAAVGIGFAAGSPAPPVLGLGYREAIDIRNTGAVPLSGLVLVDTLPVELRPASVTTGRYTGLTDFAAGEGVRVSYEKNSAPGVFTLWGSSPNTAFNTSLTAPPPGLGGGEYITRVRWEYGEAAAGMAAASPPVVAGRVLSADNAGGPVAAGDTIRNCVTLTAAPALTRDACQAFTLIAGPSLSVQTADSVPLGSELTATATLSGGDPTGSIAFRVYAASDTACATPLFDEDEPVDGARSYTSSPFPAVAAGAYKWVASYGGDGQHAAAATACNDPAGAFTVTAPDVPPASPLPTARPAPPAPALEGLAVRCSPSGLALLGVSESGRRVRFRGVARPADAGRRVLIHGRGIAALATVRADGVFAATGPRPPRRRLNRTRYFASLGERRSESVKLTRRLTARLLADTTIRGRVAPPLDVPARPVTIKRRTSCAGGYEVIARVTPDRRGRFRVRLPQTSGAAQYVAETRVRTRAGGRFRTNSLVLGRS